MIKIKMHVEKWTIQLRKRGTKKGTDCRLGDLGFCLASATEQTRHTRVSQSTY